MIPISDHTLIGSDCGTAWALAAQTLLDVPGHKMLHLSLRITNPITEDARIRALVDRLLARYELPAVPTVVNTVFPAALAARCATPLQLAERYVAMYPKIRAWDGANNRGTYFGRLVDYPADGRHVDQLNRIITQLSDPRKRGGKPYARYEINFEDAADTMVTTQAIPDQPTDSVGEESAAAGDSAAIFAPRSDANPFGCPCLVHVSFQRVDGVLHAQALYRSQYMLQRAYANYLSLGLLQNYIATQAGLGLGQLSVHIGLASVEKGVTELRHALAHRDQLSLLDPAVVPARHR
jgi:hypothetical protein